MVQFPSLEFFEALQDAANSARQRFLRLGTVDITLVAKIDYPERSECYQMVFEGYRCVSVKKLPADDHAEVGAVFLEGPESAWHEMIDNIREHGRADLEHTLNTLTLLDMPLRVSSANQLDTDRFYRYQQSLQEFFDAAGALGAGLRHQAPKPGGL